MRLTLAEPTYLKDSISIISDLVNEARFKITKDGIELIAMDPANVAMVIFKLLSSCFTEYEIKDSVEIGVNLGNLKQILRRIGTNDILSLEVTEDNKLKILIQGNTKRTFNLPLIDLEEREQKIPELKFPAKIILPSSILNNAIEDADVVGESVSFEAEPGKFTISSEGELSQAKTEITSSEEVKIEAKSKVKAKYSLEYLKKMIGGSKLSGSVIVEFDTDYPLRLDYTTVDKVMLSFILAPRVETE